MSGPRLGVTIVHRPDGNVEIELTGVGPQPSPQIKAKLVGMIKDFFEKHLTTPVDEEFDARVHADVEALNQWLAAQFGGFN